MSQRRRSAVRMTTFAPLLVLVALINPLGAQERIDVKAGYAKFEHRIFLKSLPATVNS